MTDKRFFTYVNITDDCWEWTGCRNNKGYGAFYNNGKYIGSHRYSWELHNGRIPNNLHVLHKCNNKSCVRPDHLYLGTEIDNALDTLRTGIRGVNKLTVTEVKAIKGMLKFTKLSRRDIAKIFSISLSTIKHIAAGHNWYWVHIEEEI